MSKRQIIALPDARKPASNQSPSNWYNANIGSSRFSVTDRHHIIGGLTTTNGIYMDENINAGGSGDIYSSTGFSATVQTKTSTYFKTLHYIGNPSGISLNNPAMGQTFSTSAQANFTKRVCGFWCQINGAPIGNDSSIDDGCGKCQGIRVSGVYMDSNRRLRVIEMCGGGFKLEGATWSSTVTGTKNNWVNMSYSAGVSNSQTIFNNEYLHIGWIIQMRHEKTCGGNTKQKNCTGRIRYLTPLVSSDSNGGLYFGSPNKHQVIAPRMTYSSYSSLPSNRYGIYTIL